MGQRRRLGRVRDRLLLSQGRFSDGYRVLVNGAGGAVGSLVVQVAKARGGHVTAVDTAAKDELLRTFGADVVLAHESDDFTRLDSTWDVIVDIPGNHPWKRIRSRLTPDGMYAPVGHDAFDATRHRLIGSMSWILPLMVRAIWSPHLQGFSSADPIDERMRTLHELAEAGLLRPHVEREYPLEEAAAAMRHLASGTTTGRLVLVTDPPTT